MPLQEVLDYIRNRDKTVYEVFACGNDAPSETDVTALESEIGFRLEAEFREFMMSPLGGMYYAVKREHWRRPVAYESGPFWTFIYGLVVPGIADGVPEEMDLRVLRSELIDQGCSDLVPCLRTIGDRSMYGMDRSGAIVYWYSDPQGMRDKVELTFSELLMREVKELEGRLAKRRELGMA